MPTDGYDNEASRIGARSFTRSWKFKLIVLAMFLVAALIPSGVSLIVKWIAQ